MTWTLEEINNIKEKIDEKARTDKDFRTLCLTNPERAIEQISEQKMPLGFKVRFIENEDAHFTHVLPDFIDVSDELCEEELYQVSAGSNGKLPEICGVCGSDAGFVKDDPYDIIYTCSNCKKSMYIP